MKKIFSCVLALFAAVSLYAADLNIYASGLKASQVDNTVTIEYMLNTQADSLHLMLYGEDINSALFMTETDPTALTKGAHQLVKTLPSDIPAGVYHWAIRVFSTATQFADALNGNGMYNYYLPQDIAVDNNFNSPFFGRVYVSEPYDGASDGMSDATKTQVRGIYMYNPDMTFVNGDTMAVTGYDGGMGGAHDARNAIKRIAIDDAGYLYIASRDAATQGIWRMDPANPTTPFIQIYSAAGTVDAIGIEGSRIYTLENIGVGTGSLNIYNLSASLSAPFRTLGQDTVLGFANSDCDAAYDGRGGWWIVENRYSVDAYPPLVHLNAQGAVDYIVNPENHADLLTNSNNGGVSQRGVVAVNPDGDLLAIGSNKTAIVFSIDYSGAEPALTKVYETAVIGTNIDGVAFDVANNLYFLSASVERLYAFPIPKTENQFVTPAPSNSKVYIGVPMPIQHLYEMGNNTGWQPNVGEEMTCTADNVFEGVFTFTRDTTYFAFFTDLAEGTDQAAWDYVNAHRYAGIADGTLLNKAVVTDTLVKATNTTYCVAPAGQYKLRVNLNTNKVTMFRQAPIMPDNGMYIAFKDVPGKEGGDNSSAISSIEDIIEAGADLISSIPTATKIYNAREGCGVKFGTGSAAGELKLQLVNAVYPEKIIVYATAYSATEGSAILLGDTVNLAQYGNKVIVPYEKVYDGQTAVSELTFATTEKRMYLLDLIIIPSENVQPFAYKIRHPWDLNNIDPWIWQACEEQADGTWALEDRYYSAGCNIDPKVLDQDWIEAPTLVGNPHYGDSCRFVINPAATDVAGILTITKLGEPNPIDTTVVVYEHLYEIGANQGWQPNAGVEMTKKAENVFEGEFTFSGSSDNGFDYFGFITELNASWDVVNQHRFGPATDGVLVVVGDNEMHENKGAGYSFKIAAGSYIFTVDINAMKLTIAPVTDIRNIDGENTVQKVLRNGQLYIIREGVTYTATGAKVE